MPKKAENVPPPYDTRYASTPTQDGVNRGIPNKYVRPSPPPSPPPPPKSIKK